MKELHVSIQLRNNRLLERRKQLGMTGNKLSKKLGFYCSNYSRLEKMIASPFVKPVLNICKVPECSNPANRVSHLLCKEHQDTASPGKLQVKRGPEQWSAMALALARFYKCPIEELFPDGVLAVKKPTIARQFDAVELMAKLGPDSNARLALPPDEALERKELAHSLTTALDMLEPKEKDVLVGRFIQGKTLTECGESHRNVSRERIRQIECRALAKLRHPKLAKLLEGHE